MKRLNAELLFVALLSLFMGAVVIGVALYLHRDFQSLPPLATGLKTVETLKQLYRTSEFIYAPCAGIGFIIVGLLLLRNWVLRKRTSE